MSVQKCPICSAAVEPSARYWDYICIDCSARAVDEFGRKLRFRNESFSGGFVAWYEDTNERRDSQICYIDGIKCWADEARMGGIVIRVYGGKE